MSAVAAQFTRPLQRKLQEAGLQGCIDAAAFKRLLQYAEDVRGSLDKVHEILQLLKLSKARTSKEKGSGAAARAAGNGARRRRARRTSPAAPTRRPSLPPRPPPLHAKA
jgi:hypothetical protein